MDIRLVHKVRGINKSVKEMLADELVLGRVRGVLMCLIETNVDSREPCSAKSSEVSCSAFCVAM
jgi:hypothetical protein